MKLPSKRPKERPDTLPLQYIMFDGPRIIETPIDLAPVSLIMRYFDPPKIFERNRTEKIWQCATINLNQGNEQYLIEKYNATAVDSYCGDFFGEKFVLLLAKISHSFACAAIGIDNFQPVLPDLIIKKDWKSLDLYVGGTRQENPQTNNLHELDLRKIDVLGVEHWMADLRLFSNLGMPTYHIIVGPV